VLEDFRWLRQEIVGLGNEALRRFALAERFGRLREAYHAQLLAEAGFSSYDAVEARREAVEVQIEALSQSLIAAAGGTEYLGTPEGTKRLLPFQKERAELDALQQEERALVQMSARTSRFNYEYHERLPDVELVQRRVQWFIEGLMKSAAEYVAIAPVRLLAMDVDERGGPEAVSAEMADVYHAAQRILERFGSRTDQPAAEEHIKRADIGWLIVGAGAITAGSAALLFFTPMALALAGLSLGGFFLIPALFKGGRLIAGRTQQLDVERDELRSLNPFVRAHGLLHEFLRSSRFERLRALSGRELATVHLLDFLALPVAVAQILAELSLSVAPRLFELIEILSPPLWLFSPQVLLVPIGVAVDGVRSWQEQRAARWERQRDAQRYNEAVQEALRRAEVDGGDDLGLAVHALGLAQVVVGSAADDLLGEAGHRRRSYYSPMAGGPSNTTPNIPGYSGYLGLLRA